MVVDPSGYVGIGTATPGYALDVNGTTHVSSTVTLDSTVFMPGLTAVNGVQSTALCRSVTNEVVADSANCLASSRRFKQDINSLTPADGLAEVMQLNPVSFYYKPEFNGSLQNDPNFNGKQVGFIAEEVSTVDPRLIFTDKDGLPYSVRYENTTAVLTKAIQELDAKVTKFMADQGGQWQLDSEGYVVMKKLKVEEIKIAGTGEDKSVGFGTIKQGEAAVTVKNKKVKNTSQVFVTFRDDLGGKTWYLASVNDGSDFTVKLSGNLAYDVHFSYFIVDTEQDYNAYLDGLKTAVQDAVAGAATSTVETTPPADSGSTATTTPTTDTPPADGGTPP